MIYCEQILNLILIMPEIEDTTKLYVKEQIQETRHKLSNDMQTMVFNLDSKIDAIKDKQATYDTTLKLTSQLNESLRDDLQKNNELINKLIDKIDSLGTKYTSKEESENTKKTVNNIIKRLFWAISLVLWGLIVKVLNLIIENGSV